MDNFTFAVVVGDALVVAALIALMVMDKGSPSTPEAEPAKVTTKR